MSPRNTLLLLVVVALAAALVWWFEVRGAEERAEADEAARLVFRELEAGEVTWIELRTTGGEVARLERDETEGWRLVEPLEFPADSLAADGIASALTELVSERVFEEHEPLEAYGLEGEPEVRFGTADASHALHIGDTTPVGGNTYVAPDEGDPVHAVATWRTNALQKSLADLREARVLDFDRDAVTALVARWPGGHVRAERSEGGWRLAQPIATDADAEAIEGLLADLHFLRADDFVDDPPADAELGLAEPAFVAELFREGEAEPVRLAVGSTTEGATRAVRGRDGRVYRIAAARLEDFPRRVDAYRFKEMARFDPAQAQRLEIVFHPEEGDPVRIEGVRGDDAGWTTEPEALAAGKAGALLTELSGLDARGVAADAVGEEELAGLGLAPPRAHIRVLGAPPGEGEGELPVLADLSLGVLRAGSGVAARRAGREEVFWLDEDVAEHVPVSLEAWRNRFVSPAPSEEPAGAQAPAAAEEAPAAEEPPAAEEGAAEAP